MVELPGLGALALVSVEWLGLGWLSGVSFPPPRAPATWALRLLVGSCLVAFAQLALALAGVGFASIPVVLLAAGVGAAALRVLAAASVSGGVGARPAAVGADPGVTHETHVKHEAEVNSEANIKYGAKAKHVPIGARERLGWLLLGVLLLAALVRSLLVPESGWDAYSHWGLRAQAFATAGTIVDAHSEHEYYPPLVPLLEAWLYLHGGTVAIDLGKTVWAVIGGAFAVCLAWQLRLSLRAAWLGSFFATAIVLASPMLLESFWTGQADLALTAYLTLSALAVYQWQRAADSAWLIQAALFTGAAVLTKFEGLPRIGILIVAIGVCAVITRRRENWRPLATLIVTAAIAASLWTAMQVMRGIAPNAEHVGAFQPLAIGGVLLALAAVFGGLRIGGGLLVAALAWAVAGRAVLRRNLTLLTLTVLGQLVATLVAFLVSATAPDLEVRTSATRLFEQFMPLALFVGAVGLDRLHL